MGFMGLVRLAFLALANLEGPDDLRAVNAPVDELVRRFFMVLPAVKLMLVSS